MAMALDDFFVKGGKWRSERRRKALWLGTALTGALVGTMLCPALPPIFFPLGFAIGVSKYHQFCQKNLQPGAEDPETESNHKKTGTIG